jgi:hypothetical protein
VVGYYRSSTRTRPLIGHWTGTSWKIVPSPNVGSGNSFLLAVAARTASDVWAVGQRQRSPESFPVTLIEHGNGTRWRVARTPSPGTGDDALSGIAEIPHRGGFWAVGNAGDSTLIETHC